LPVKLRGGENKLKRCSCFKLFAVTLIPLMAVQLVAPVYARYVLSIDIIANKYAVSEGEEAVVDVLVVFDNYKQVHEVLVYLQSSNGAFIKENRVTRINNNNWVETTFRLVPKSGGQIVSQVCAEVRVYDDSGRFLESKSSKWIYFRSL